MKVCARCGHENFTSEANCSKCNARLPAASKPQGATSINGIGSTFYGERDYAPDGSYLTTEFLIFLNAPIVPIRSLRVIRTGKEAGDTSTTTHYRVLSVQKLHILQVVSVYLFALVFAAAGILALTAITRGWFGRNVVAMVIGTVVLLSSPHLFATILQHRARLRAGLR
jgi:hypothetical protein